MRIDSHLHVNHRDHSLEFIIDYLDANHFDFCWLMTWDESVRGPWYYENLSIEDVYETYMSHPDRIIPMYGPDPNRDDAAERLLQWHQKGIRGCAEIKTTLNWNSKKLSNFLPTVEKLKMPLVFHMEESSKIMVSLEGDSFFEKIALKFFRSEKLLGLPRKIANQLFGRFDSVSEWKKKRTYSFPGYMLDFASLSQILEDYPGINFVGHGPLFWKNISADIGHSGILYPKGEIEKEGLVCVS